MKYFSRSGFLHTLVGVPPVKATHKSADKPEALQNGNANVSNKAVSGLKPFAGTLNDKQRLHLIRRTLFGGTYADLQYFSGKTLKQCLDILLTQSPEPAPPLNTYSGDNLKDPDVPFGKTWVHAPFLNPASSDDGSRLDSLKSWWLGQMINQGRSLTEKMTVFWSNHIAAQMFLMKDSRLSYLYLSMLRAFSLGNFKKLIREITTNPGMLVYLNGDVSTAAAPNENYARELQELFTVGKGPGSHYTEQDVKEAARVLTGWQVKDNPGGNVSSFNPERHDIHDKQFSAFYNNQVIKGKGGKGGASETDDLINMIFRQHEVAKFVCRNIYRWFVYYKIDDTIEANIISPLADIFIKSDFEIKPVLRALLGSEHFFDPANIGCQIKSPVDHTIGACRQMFLVGYPDDLRKQYLQWSQLLQRIMREGMEPGDPPNVAGWPAYYQIPVFAEAWINATTLTERDATTDELVRTQFDLIAFAAQFPKPSDVNELIADSCKILGAVPFAAAEIAVMKSILLSGQVQEHYWTDAWQEYMADTKNEINKSVVMNRLIPFYAHLLQRAEYQLN